MTNFELILEEINDFYENDIITESEAIDLQLKAIDKYVLTEAEATDEEKEQAKERKKKILKIVGVATAALVAIAVIKREIDKRNPKSKAKKEILELEKDIKGIMKKLKGYANKDVITRDEVMDIKTLTSDFAKKTNKIKSISNEFGIDVKKYLKDLPEETKRVLHGFTR